jgi:hypothetical protein
VAEYFCAQVTSGGGGKGRECKRHRYAAKEAHRRLWF